MPYRDSMLVLPQERVHNRWRDSITPPVQIIGSQTGRKRKFYDEDESVASTKQLRPSLVKEDADKLYDKKSSIPWYKDLLDKISIKEEIRKSIPEFIETGHHTESEPRDSMESSVLRESAYASLQARADRDERIRAGALARINAILSRSPSDILRYEHRDRENLFRTSNDGMPYDHELRIRDRYERLGSTGSVDLDRKREISDYHRVDAQMPHWEGRHGRGDRFEVEHKGKCLDFATAYHPEITCLKKEKDECHQEGADEFCRLCVETAHSEGGSSLERGKVPPVSPPLRIPARRLSPSVLPHSPSPQFQNGRLAGEFQKSDQSAFSIFRGDLGRRISSSEYDGSRLQSRIHCDLSREQFNDRYWLESQLMTRASHSRPPIFVRDIRDTYPPSFLEDRRTSLRTLSPGTDKIYDDMKYDCFQKLAGKDQKGYSSPESQFSDDSGFVSGPKDTISKGDGISEVVQASNKRGKGKSNDCFHLWEFLRDMLNNETMIPKCMEWTNRETGEFRLIKTGLVAKMWGQSKNRTSMTYEKMARAMRYYYKIKILEKVPNKRLHFRFGGHMLPKVLVDCRPHTQMQQCI